ncbi:YDG/SRA domain-containing protein [Kineococcus glutinatus]|uniref:HNH endonuclease n=1 Tax=Kineococcus glutinatus TaxID=1070872 RepID=A0ABP9HED5_9ACTN
MAKHFGHVPGVQVGSAFATRRALHDAGVHPPIQAGIHGTAAEGADSIVVNGGYPTDEDQGTVILYTGHGGLDQDKRVQVADQTLSDAGNAGLVRSELDGLPVRVTRGFRGDSAYSPKSGYRYDGLYRVDEHYPATANGYRVWMFKLTELDNDAPPTSAAVGDAGEEHGGPVATVTSTVQRQVRNTSIAQDIKRLYDHTCQMCGQRTTVAGGAGYSEGAHIKALGKPHHGPDVRSNVLCLCPTCHVRFDKGGLYLLDNLTVVDAGTGSALGILTRRKQHTIDVAYVRYHRELWASAGSAQPEQATLL